jgi:rSAM/selenodomain-associated transferase 2
VVSIIIPLYNEEGMLKAGREYFCALSRTAELIFVDGGSEDSSREFAAGLGKVFTGPKGRGLQMNLGARNAGGQIILFLHVDSRVTPDTLASIEKKVFSEGYAGGCLTLRIDGAGLPLRIIEGFGNLRARMTKVFYGDQGIFVKKDVFWDLGGFPEVPIMEDVIFTGKLRRFGRTAVLREPILVSGRRWRKYGICRTVLLYTWINILFRLGVSLPKIKRIYEDVR